MGEFEDYYTNQDGIAEMNRQRLGDIARARANQRTRDVMELRLIELTGGNSGRRQHRRRESVVIDGVTVAETLRQRLTRESRELEQAVTALAHQLARRTEQLEHLARYPEVDTFENGDILHFDKTFPGSDYVYSYVAHKANDRWHLTGDRSPNDITWDELVSFMGLGVHEVYKIGGRGGRRKVIG